MPAKAGIQYAVTNVVENGRRGILDHPLSRMMTAVQDGAVPRIRVAVVEGRSKSKGSKKKCLKLP
jgi:hypothetical protein